MTYPINNLPNVEKSGWPWTEESPSMPPTMPDGSPWPKISIVTPSFNQGQFLEETIRSVLLQGYPNFEYIIMDGGSTDGSAEIIKKYEPWLTYWVSEPDDGQSQAINKGFSLATGEIGGWLNSDDIYFTGALRTVASCWIENGKPISLITGTKLKGNSTLDSITRIEQEPFTLEHLISKYILEQPSTFFPLNLFREVGGIDLSYDMSLDYDLFLRMTGRGAVILFTGTDLAISRSHPSSKTALNQRLSLFESIRSIWKNYRVLPNTWLKKLITYLVVPAKLKSKHAKTVSYIIRDVIYKLARVILGFLKLSDYHEK